MPEDWLDQEIWRVSKSWTWAEIEMILCIWMIDESAVYLNLNNPYKASVWLARATRHRYLSLWLNDDSLADAKKMLASLGGKARHAATHEKRDQIIAYWCINIGPDKSNEFAAELLQKEFPEVSHRTLARYVAEAKKLPPASTL